MAGVSAPILFTGARYTNADADVMRERIRGMVAGCDLVSGLEHTEAGKFFALFHGIGPSPAGYRAADDKFVFPDGPAALVTFAGTLPRPVHQQDNRATAAAGRHRHVGRRRDHSDDASGARTLGTRHGP